MLSHYRTPSNVYKTIQKISNREIFLEGTQITSNDLKRPQLTPKESSAFIETVKPNTSKKENLKGGANIEINDKYSDEFLHSINPQIELAMQIISNEETIKKHSTRFKRF